MKARITVYDDNDNPKGSYVLIPSKIFEYEQYNRYVFAFEFTELNYGTTDERKENE